MCVICIEWQKGKMTNEEALRALGELISATEDRDEKGHYFDAVDKIMEEEVPNSAD